MVPPLLAAGVRGAKVVKSATKKSPTVDQIARRGTKDSITKTRELRAAAKEKKEQRLDSQEFNDYTDNNRRKNLRRRLAQTRKLATRRGISGVEAVTKIKKKAKAVSVTFRIWAFGAGWAYIFIQLPAAVFGIGGLGIESFVSSIPVVGGFIEVLVPGETAFMAGSGLALIIGILTLVGSLVLYSVSRINSFGTIPQIFAFSFALGCYVMPGLNFLPCAAVWMLVVIWQAGD